MNRIIHILMTLLIVVVVIFTTANLTVLEDIRKDVIELRNMTRDMEQASLELNLPMSIVAETHTENRTALDDSTVTDYNRYVQQALKLTESVKLASDQLEETAAKSHLMRFEPFAENLKIIQALAEEVETINGEVSHYLAMTIDEKEAAGDLYIEKLQEQQIPLSIEITDRTNELTSAALRRLIRFSNILIISAALLLLLLTLIVEKRQDFQNRFIRRGFTMVREKDFVFQKIEKVAKWFPDEREIYGDLKRYFEEEKLREEINRIVTRSYDLDSVVEMIYRMLKDRMRVVRIGVAFIDYQNEKIMTEVSVTDIEPVLLKAGYKVGFSETSMYSIIEHKEGIICNDLEEAFRQKPDSKSLSLIIQEGIKSNMVLPFMSGDRVFGMVFISSDQKDYFDSDMMLMMSRIISELTEVLRRSYLIKVAFKQFTLSFSELVDNKDVETGDHLERMTSYSDIITEFIYNNPKEGYEIDARFIKDIHDFAATHDLGKVAVDDAILKKPGKLTPQEWRVMQSHVTVGEEIIRNIRESMTIFDTEYFKVAEEIIAGHHERWDGSGYPRGLKGEEIPLSARIVALADVFDALTSTRVYKEAFSFEKAVETIREERGKHFDPYVVDAFFSSLFQIHQSYLLNSDENIIYTMFGSGM